MELANLAQKAVSIDKYRVETCCVIGELWIHFFLSRFWEYRICVSCKKKQHRIRVRVSLMDVTKWGKAGACLTVLRTHRVCSMRSMS